MQERYAVSSYVEAQIARWRRQGYVPDLDHYIYNADFNPIPEAGSLSQVNATDEDRGFVAFALTYRAVTVHSLGSPQQLVETGQFLLQITRSDGYALQDRPTDINNVAGIGIRPGRFYVPFVVPPRSSWETTVSNLDTIDQWFVQVAFHGAKYRLRPRGAR